MMGVVTKPVEILKAQISSLKGDFLLETDVTLVNKTAFIPGKPSLPTGPGKVRPLKGSQDGQHGHKGIPSSAPYPGSV